MSHFDFQIGGTTGDLTTVWADLQDPYKRAEPSDFALNIPLKLAYGLVNSESAAVSNEVLVQKFKEHLQIFGTVSADFLLRHLCQSANLKPKPYKWALASIDSAQVVSDRLKIEGRVVPLPATLN